MIRSYRIPLDKIQSWLPAEQTESTHANYRLSLRKEDVSKFEPCREHLFAYINESLEDAKMKIRAGFEDSLSPFTDDQVDPAANFPDLLNSVTLFGYFGEVLAGIAVEHFGFANKASWIVPAFLIRTHSVELQHLELINEQILSGQPYNPDAVENRRPGRTGDDCLAFRVSESGMITDILTIEAKCLAAHNAEKIREAHAKLNNGPLRPSGVRELINLLADYNTDATNQWKAALLEVWRTRASGINRYDAVLYACGQSPVRRSSWLSASEPHSEYVNDRWLEGLEFHFGDLAALVENLYRRGRNA